LTRVDDACSDCLSQAQSAFSKINIYDIYVDVCLASQSSTHYAVSQLAAAGSPVHRFLDEAMKQEQSKKRDVIPPYTPCLQNYLTDYLLREDVIKAIHATACPIPWTECSNQVQYSYADVLTSVVPLYHKIMAEYPHIKMFVYSGDVDAIVPYWGSRQWISTMNLPITKPWRMWLTPDDKQAGGFVQEYSSGKLTFITVRDAGHMVPRTQPKRAYHMINFIVNGDPL